MEGGTEKNCNRCGHSDATRCSGGSSLGWPSRGLRIQRGAAPVYMLAPWRGAGGGPRGELSGVFATWVPGRLDDFPGASFSSWVVF